MAIVFENSLVCCVYRTAFFVAVFLSIPCPALACGVRLSFGLASFPSFLVFRLLFSYDDEMKDFAYISKKLDEISLAIDSLNLWVDKTAGEQGLNLELLNAEKEKLK